MADLQACLPLPPSLLGAPSHTVPGLPVDQVGERLTCFLPNLGSKVRAPNQGMKRLAVTHSRDGTGSGALTKDTQRPSGSGWGRPGEHLPV